MREKRMEGMNRTYTVWVVSGAHSVPDLILISQGGYYPTLQMWSWRLIKVKELTHDLEQVNDRAETQICFCMIPSPVPRTLLHNPSW